MFHKSKRYGTQPWCKECSVASRIEYYKNNKAKEQARNQKWKLTLKQWYFSLKNKPCTDCGKSYPHYVMQFDHTEGDKEDCVSVLVGKSKSKKTILDEIAKCELVCANCHAERTFRRRELHNL